MGDYITFRRDRSSRGGGVFICFKNHISCKELRTDEDLEIIAVEINSRDHKYTWEIVGLSSSSLVFSPKAGYGRNQSPVR